MYQSEARDSEAQNRASLLNAQAKLGRCGPHIRRGIREPTLGDVRPALDTCSALSWPLSARNRSRPVLQMWHVRRPPLARGVYRYSASGNRTTRNRQQSTARPATKGEQRGRSTKKETGPTAAPARPRACARGRELTVDSRVLAGG